MFRVVACLRTRYLQVGCEDVVSVGFHPSGHIIQPTCTMMGCSPSWYTRTGNPEYSLGEDDLAARVEPDLVQIIHSPVSLGVSLFTCPE